MRLVQNDRIRQPFLPKPQKIHKRRLEEWNMSKLEISRRLRETFTNHHGHSYLIPQAPCTWRCGKPLHRFHLTCLTCPTRRLAKQKTPLGKWAHYDKVLIMLESPSGRGFDLPRHYRAYGLIINTDTKLCGLKLLILKWLRTIEERIAEW